MLSHALAEALIRLDRRLESLVAAEERRAALLAGDGSAGWEGVRNLIRPRTEALFAAGPSEVIAPTAPDLVFARISTALGMGTTGAGDILLMLLAPFVEPRYQNVYALLQDDPHQPLATERLLVAALSRAPSRRGEIGALLRSGGALRRSGLIVAPAGRYAPLRQPFTLSEEVAAALLGEPATGLAGAGELRCEDGSGGNEIPRPPARILFGSGGLGKRAIADVPGGTRAMHVRLTQPGSAEPAAATVAAAWRLGLILDVCPIVDLRALSSDTAQAAAAEAARLAAAFGGSLQLLSSRPLPCGLPHLRCDPPAWSQRRVDWLTAAESAGVMLDDGVAGSLASRHRTEREDMAGLLAQLSPGLMPDEAQRTLDALIAGTRAATAQRAVVRTPRLTLDDLVLRPTARAGLDRLVHFIKARDRVDETHPGRRHLDMARGPVALFHGRPGTGKTVAAEAVAAALSRPFYSVDLSQLVSKYVGETEKHIDETLIDAEQAGAILFFDEADALFSKRVEKASSGGEQFSNMVLGYILPRIEIHDGPIILATNLMQGMDEALMRRFRFRTEFPLPDAGERHQIWARMLGAVAGVDLAALGAAHQLSGGEIRNAALKAVFLADQRGVPIGQALLEAAVRLELYEMGRLSRDPSDAGVAEDRGAVLRGAARALKEALDGHLRSVFLKEIHIQEGAPTEKALSGQRPALSLAMYRLAGRRGGTKDGEGLRLGFVLSAWCQRPEEELEILGVVHAFLSRPPSIAAGVRPLTLRLQESHDFEMLQRFWSSHEQPVKPSLVLEVEID
ncbi:AAA family ATPase [Mesorhizobium yinganensis]|uniref:AAA family ATPase n=1 Tax=Mesorhizobium yinganensis TaxID=3157707 RepID=UPI0032B77C32